MLQWSGFGRGVDLLTLVLILGGWAGLFVGLDGGLVYVCVWICSNNKGPDWFC